MPVLPENGARRGLKEDIVVRVTARELALNLGGKIIVNILGLPVAVGKAEVVDESPINDDAHAAAGVERILGHKRPAALKRALFEKGLEGSTDGCFVGDAQPGKLLKGGVVGFDGLVDGFEV